MAKTAVRKQVQVVMRIQFKEHENAVLYIVRSSNGVDTYETTLVNGHATGCTCPAVKPCYHMTQLEQRESERASDVAQHLQDEATVHSCVCCGARVRKENSLCYDCCN